jgi:hypothetical protein
VSMTSRRAFCAAAIVGLAIVGCLSVPTGVAALGGRYELRSVDGRTLPDERLGGALRGELVLTPLGQARRVVTYARSGLPDPYVHRAAGTYRVSDGRVTLTLTEEANPSSSPWRITGDVQGSTIVLRYVGRTDRVIEEQYVKVP